MIGGAVAVVLLAGGFFLFGKSSPPNVAPAATPSPARAESQAKTAKDQLNEILGLVRDNRWKDVKNAAANLKALAQAPQGNRRLSDEQTQIGIQNFEARNYSEAIAQFEKAVGADASNVEPRFYLGRALNRTGKFDTAKNVLIDALIIQPDRGASWFTTAEVFAELDKKEEATFALKLAVFFSKNREQAIASLKDRSKIESDKFWKIIEDVRPVLSGVPSSN
jgi:predicted Zn-dependent protease